MGAVHTFRVVLALGPLALSLLRDHHRWLWWGRGVPRSPDFHARRARRLVETIVGLGPSFVKIAQVFASRSDLIPEPYLAELGTLVDQVPPLPFETVERAIVEAYGRPVDELFDRFEREPIAAASLAQVHRAVLRGETVAVKVLRPGVEAQVAADIKAARQILNVLDRWWGHPHIKRELTGLAAFETRVREEVDFRLEAAYATAIRANFDGNPHVVIPRVHPDMTRQRVLVMEFMKGTRIDRLDPATVDVRQVVQTLVELYIQMELVDGLFHADPHPGNMMLDAQGRIVLVDFGAVVRVPLKQRRALVHTSIAAIRRDSEGVARGFADLGLLPADADPRQIRWIAELLITNAYSRTTARERIDTLLADRVLKTLFDSPITLTEEAVYFARTAALIEGIGTRYDPYFQIVPVASPVVLRMRTKILTSLGETVQPNIQEIATVAGYAMGRAARWMKDKVSGTWLERFTPAGAAVLLFALGSLGCASGPRGVVLSPPPAPVHVRPMAMDAGCDGCAPVAMRPEVARAIEGRITELKTRGGNCQVYGEALERTYVAGKIVLRPYMWRVAGNLASGTAHGPEGDMTLAVDIDSLNVGVRTLDDMLRSVEHEAAHLAFQDLRRDEVGEAEVDRRVRACRPERNASSH
jgi:predicted unusual protein kinase regulating ubiquinone biosynthesis (AarF/ABC1/UbiB family)